MNGVETSGHRGLGKLLEPVQRRLSRVDLREHEDKILLLLALVISAVVGLIVVAFVAVTERMGRVLVNAGAIQRFLSPLVLLCYKLLTRREIAPPAVS